MNVQCKLRCFYFPHNLEFRGIKRNWWCCPCQVSYVSGVILFFLKTEQLQSQYKCYIVSIHCHVRKQNYWSQNVTADSFFCFLLCLASPSQFLDCNSLSVRGIFHIVLLKCTAVFSSSILTHLRIAEPDFFESVPIFQMASLLFLRS